MLLSLSLSLSHIDILEESLNFFFFLISNKIYWFKKKKKKALVHKECIGVKYSNTEITRINKTKDRRE